MAGIHVALKCNFEDGSTTSGYTGFEGTCSADNILYNVRRGRAWCSSADCECRQWVDEGAPSGWYPQDPCYEARIFLDWRMGTGVYQRGPRAGEPDVPSRFEDGSTALLTTVLPDERDEDRLVFGVLGNTSMEVLGNSHYIVGDPAVSLRLPQDLWLPYRQILKREKRKRWGSHLYRYLDDQEVGTYLHALYPLLQSPRDRSVAERLLDQLGAGKKSLPRPRPVVLKKATTLLELRRKYGPGGEGKDHKRLKQLVYDQPTVLGITGVKHKHLERRFDTGDRADVAFVLKNGTRAVVEVEVEGEEACRIGAMQAVKYRALEAAHIGLSDPGSVIAFLVAHRIGSATRVLCKKLEVRVVQIPRWEHAITSSMTSIATGGGPLRSS